MKKILMSAMAIFFAVSFINAQETRPAPNSAIQVQEVNGNYVETFRKDFNVSDDQIGRIRVLHTETVNRYNTMDPKFFQSEDVYKSRVREILNERDESLRSILTQEQFSIYNANRIRYDAYDSRNFTDDLNRRRSMMAPDMKQNPSDGQIDGSRQPNETRPANPTPTMDNPQK